MLSPNLQLLALTLALAPSLTSAAIFPPNTQVKMLDVKGFKKAMKMNVTSMVAFVAPWCGHCQRMAPEYSKAAKGLHPLVPLYAVDCDDEGNKRLCADQGVQGFPTVKLFPRGGLERPMTYESGERTASAFFNWASRRVPNTITKLSAVGDVSPWSEKTKLKHRALLVTKDKKIPLLWKVLGNKYRGKVELGIHKDNDGKVYEELGVENTAKVLIYPAGSSKPVRYEGVTKLEALSKFFDSVVNGTAYLDVGDAAKEEESVPDEPMVDPISQGDHPQVVFDSAKEKTPPSEGDHLKDEL
ncbi:thioredoxin-like protein [Tricholoma matsutake]|nr:thioredoxin-like protein [Tricholoma matsutake 945]